MMAWQVRVRIIALGVGVLLACTPTEPCACPPATSLFRVFGRGFTANGTPAPDATIAGYAADMDCASPQWESLDAVPSGTAADGTFRSTLRSIGGPAVRCLRLVAYAASPGSSDSTVTPNLIVSFRIDRQTPDSLGVELHLP